MKTGLLEIFRIDQSEAAWMLILLGTNKGPYHCCRVIWLLKCDWMLPKGAPMRGAFIFFCLFSKYFLSWSQVWSPTVNNSSVLSDIGMWCTVDVLTGKIDSMLFQCTLAKLSRSKRLFPRHSSVYNWYSCNRVRFYGAAFYFQYEYCVCRDQKLVEDHRFCWTWHSLAWVLGADIALFLFLAFIA